MTAPRSIVLCSRVQSAIVPFGGSLKDIVAPDLGAIAIKAAVARANGVGPKLALRIVTELKGKPLGAGLAMPMHTGAGPIALPIVEHPTASGEAVAALIGLGVAEPLGRRAVETAAARLGPDATLPVLIKSALQELSR